MACVLGLDIGTTSTVGILIRLPDQVIGLASRPVTLLCPEPGWAEEDPEQWWNNVCAVISELLAGSGISPEELAAVGVAGMLPALVLLDDSGTVLRNSIQQSDARCGREIAELAREVAEQDFLARTGNGIGQQVVATKLRWLRRHEPAVFGRIATAFGSYDFVNWKLTGVRAVEQNWALEAAFTDLRTGSIDDALVALAQVPRAVVPRRSASHERLGHVTAQAAAATGLPEGLAVVGGTADHVASALGAGVVASGDVLLKFGGSVDVLVATRHIVVDPRIYLDYHLVPGMFMPNGCMATGGSALNWFARTFAGGEREAAARCGRTLHQHLDHLADAIPAGAQGVAVAPYFLGEKTPIHDPALRGVFAGVSLNHGLPHLWRALLESYAYALRHHLEVFNDLGCATRRFVASDGGSESRVWMQIVADVLQVPLQRLSGHPGSCLGAAWTAAMGMGLTQDWNGISAFVSQRDLIQPDPDHADVYERGYRNYRSLHTLSAAWQRTQPGSQPQ